MQNDRQNHAIIIESLVRMSRNLKIKNGFLIVTDDKKNLAIALADITSVEIIEHKNIHKFIIFLTLIMLYFCASIVSNSPFLIFPLLLLTFLLVVISIFFNFLFGVKVILSLLYYEDQLLHVKCNARLSKILTNQ